MLHLLLVIVDLSSDVNNTLIVLELCSSKNAVIGGCILRKLYFVQSFIHDMKELTEISFFFLEKAYFRFYDPNFCRI